MNFIPEEQEGKAKDVPYFSDVTGDGGWQGHGTGKSIDRLKSDIMEIITRLGGLVTGFSRGVFHVNSQEREGFQLLYTIESGDGSLVPGRIDIAALPVKADTRRSRSIKTRKDKSLRMALYMVKQALDGVWFLQQLSPGYAALMPWMIGKDNKTISQLWADSPIMNRLLPASVESDDFVDGSATEIE